MADKPVAVKALEEEVDEGRAQGDPQKTYSEQGENPVPAIDQIPVDDTFRPSGQPAPPVRPHQEVNPAPKISTAYPKVKLKNYDRRGSF